MLEGRKTFDPAIKSTASPSSLRAGEILGIAALEGQGQDRLFDLLAGDRRPDSGEVMVEGKPIGGKISLRRNSARGGAGAFRSAAGPAAQTLGAGEPCAFPSTTESVAGSIWWGTKASEPTRRSPGCRSTPGRQRQVRRLSGGNQQKVVIGRWLATGFRTLLCFDPTRGIDIQTKTQIYDLLREIADTGAAVLIYTSELPEIPLVCDRVLVLYNGQVVHEQAGATATEEGLLSAAHGLGQTA